MITQGSVFLLILCCLVLSTPAFAQSCNRCFCSSQLVICRESQLTTVPQDFPASISYMDLAGNNIAVLDKGSLSRYTRLVSLNLNDNQLVFISSKAFEANTMLTSLNLQDNDLRELQPNTFSALSDLETLDLSNNQITDISERTFAGLENLRTLSLSRNRLGNIPASAMKPLTALETMKANGNQIHCDCRIAWMKSYGPLRNAINSPVVCTSPSALRGTRLEEVELSSLECTAPTVTAVSRLVRVLRGQADVELRCVASGNPAPMIQWFFRGEKLFDSLHYRLPKNGSLVIISMVPHLAGDYLCFAGNLIGNDTDTVSVEYGGSRLPTIEISPNDLHSFKGEDIFLQCVVDQFADSVYWEKDGARIESNRISMLPAGLLIRRAIIDDSGTYTCVAENDAGQTTASAFVNVTGDLLSCSGIISQEDVDRLGVMVELAFNATQLRLKDAAHSPSALLRRLKFPQGGLIQRLKAAEVFDQSLSMVRSRLLSGNLTVRKRPSIPTLSRCEVEILSKLSGCKSHNRIADCSSCYHRKYRTFDGTCNNLDYPLRGAAEVPFLRLIPPEYEDGIGLPVGWSTPRPSARHISQRIIAAKEVTPSKEFTLMLMQMGQFLDHDLDLAPSSPSGIVFNTAEPENLQSCDDICHNDAPCFPIQVPEDDKRINRSCLSFTRSSAVCGTGAASLLIGDVGIHREQLNEITSHIDGSQIYGSTNTTAESIRTLDGTGRLRSGDDIEQFSNKYFLPFDNVSNSLVECATGINEHRSSCFLAGDKRANEQVGLTTMHTLFFHEHNRVARILADLNPHWDGEMLYQEARRIVIAEWQNIVYTEYVPKILGEAYNDKYTGYDSSVDPTIANGFATAAYRFGHSQIMPLFPRLDAGYKPSSVGPLQLQHAFFAPFRLLEEGGIDPLLRGLIASPVKLRASHQGLNNNLTEALFQQAHEVALDLAALNIQRGRDHGLSNYNRWRAHCGLPAAKRIADLHKEISNDTVRDRLQEVYGDDPDRIDLWVGGLVEDTLPGSQLGPTFSCIISDQFQRLRTGDRFYFEREGQFSPDQLVQLQQASLSRIICDNADNITRVPVDAFVLQEVSEFVSCEDLPTVDLQLWRDCPDCAGSCHSNRNVRSTLFKSMELQDQYNELNIKVAAIQKEIGLCIHNGNYYQNGEVWESTDCESCSCQGGLVECSEIECPQPSCDNPVERDGQCCPVCME